MDEKTWLADHEALSPEELRAARRTERFQRFEASWAEQRAYLTAAVAALGDSPLGREARGALAALAPAPPDRGGFAPEPDPAARFEADHVTAAFDPRSGAITTLVDRATGRAWASPARPLARIWCEVFSQADYDRFWDEYVVNKEQTAAWSREDFTKPGIGRVLRERRAFAAGLAGMESRRDDAGLRVLLDLRVPEEASFAYGCPLRFTLEVAFPRAERLVSLDLRWFDKPACRLPAAIWISFQPDAPEAQGWMLDKMGRPVSPLDVVPGGGRALHAVGAGVSYRDAGGAIAVETLDAPLIAPGAPALLRFDREEPDLARGVHVNLYNNVWGTNFPMWYEEDARFRFAIRIG
jgi:hypothetical protein